MLEGKRRETLYLRELSGELVSVGRLRTDGYVFGVLVTERAENDIGVEDKRNKTKWIHEKAFVYGLDTPHRPQRIVLSYLQRTC